MSKHKTPTVTRLLQRQILPTQSDSDVFRLYVDPEAAVPFPVVQFAARPEHQGLGAARLPVEEAGKPRRSTSGTSTSPSRPKSRPR